MTFGVRLLVFQSGLSNLEGLVGKDDCIILALLRLHLKSKVRRNEQLSNLRYQDVTAIPSDSWLQDF